jgi:hypothetical protein
MMKVDGNFITTVVREILRDVTDERFTEYGNGRLGAVFS